MSPVSRGFHRKREAAPADRVPPGQYVTQDFPVLSAGPTPHTAAGSLDVLHHPRRASRRAGRGTEFRALPAETLTTDIHCVTRWSKLDTAWQGVSLDVLLAAVEYDEPLRAGLLRRRLHHEPAGGRPARREGVGGIQLRRCSARRRARRPGPAAGPAPVLLEERQVGARAASSATPTSPASGRTTATTSTETHGGNSGTRATDLADRHGRLRSPTRPLRCGTLHARGAGLAGPPGRAARGHPADRRRRLSGRTVLLHRLGAGRAARDHRGAAGRRGGLART